MSGVIKAEYALCSTMLAQQKNSSDSGCPVSFDKSLCWSHADYGQEMSRMCPFTYCPDVPGCAAVAERYLVTRMCSNNGAWEQSNYNQCITVGTEYKHCIVGFCHFCPDMMRDLVIGVSLTLSIVSVVLLVAAIVLFSAFDSIQCRRLSIHKNLATAFVFRFAVLAVWTIMQSSNFFQDCTTFNPRYIMEYEWFCKLLLWLLIYFQVASVMWMLIEGTYLCSRFTVFAMRSTEAPFRLYLLCGWGIPFVVVLSWTIIHQIRSVQNHSYCWLPYAQGPHLWILVATMGVALVLNLVFLLIIVIILALKLRSENTSESKKIWRAIKATLLLVPLLGISNIPLFYEPDEQSSAYMLGSAILQHSQGIFIAVLYCFLNSEIQNALFRQLSKFHIFRQRQRFETERTYVPEKGGVGNHRLGVPMEELNGSAQKAKSIPSLPSPSPPNTTNNTTAENSTPLVLDCLADIRPIDSVEHMDTMQ